MRLLDSSSVQITDFNVRQKGEEFFSRDLGLNSITFITKGMS